jgi:hypothetical protein
MQVSSDSRIRLALVCVCVTLLVWIVGFGLDRWLARDGVTRVDILLVSNLLTGVVAGALFFNLSNYERLRRNLVRERLRTIADMNHHIRNALQVITYATASEPQSDSVEMIRSSVERIEWALREVLPGHVTSSDVLPEQERQEEPTRVR